MHLWHDDISRRSAITRAAMQSLENQIWRSRLAIATKLKRTTLASYQYSCMVRTAGRYLRRTHERSMHSTSGVCVCCLIKWYEFVRNDDVRRLTKQPKLTAIIQSRRLTLFGHTMHMDDNADAKRILLASYPVDWRRQPGRPRITWLSTVQQDLKQHHLTLPEAADLAQNRPLWRMMSTLELCNLRVACQKRRRVSTPSTEVWQAVSIYPDTVIKY